jgi:hypothetical protein
VTKPVKFLLMVGGAFALYELYSAMSAPPVAALPPAPTPPPNVTFSPGTVLPTNATLGSLSGSCFGRD